LPQQRLGLPHELPARPRQGERREGDQQQFEAEGHSVGEWGMGNGEWGMGNGEWQEPCRGGAARHGHANPWRVRRKGSAGIKPSGIFLFPIPYSLFPIPYSLFPIPYSLSLPPTLQ